MSLSTNGNPVKWRLGQPQPESSDCAYRMWLKLPGFSPPRNLCRRPNHSVKLLHKFCTRKSPPPISVAWQIMRRAIKSLNGRRRATRRDSRLCNYHVRQPSSFCGRQLLTRQRGYWPASSVDGKLSVASNWQGSK